jgi:peptidoglycan/xylan/chitin deacetylase (PgdA/CDA1 family)
MKMFVLAYHSHNISGSEYATNDHVAFASDLETLARAGAQAVPLETIVETMRSGKPPVEASTLVGLTFDDGPRFDFADFEHPRFGPQRGFLNIMRDFQRDHPGGQPHLNATSFVIASPAARTAMERSEDCGYTYLERWLGDDWWSAAADTGLLSIGNHSWDHVHHAVEPIAIRGEVRDNFELVNNYGDADSEIRRAGDYINARVGGRCRMFAFPFGHTNDYLVRDYLPFRRDEHGMEAAFGTGGRAVRADDSIWNIPRAVCGHDWKSPAGLEALLAR